MITGMVPILGVVWHFWIAVALVVPAILLVVGIIVGYVIKVEMPRYPRD
jgi:preprotein translocase subunit Sss1